MTLTHLRCADGGGKNVEGERTATIKDGAPRPMYSGASCGGAFSQTKPPPRAHWQPPMAVIVQGLSALTAGVGLHAATRLDGVSKNRLSRWPERLSG